MKVKDMRAERGNNMSKEEIIALGTRAKAVDTKLNIILLLGIVAGLTVGIAGYMTALLLALNGKLEMGIGCVLIIHGVGRLWTRKVDSLQDEFYSLVGELWRCEEEEV